MRRHLLLLVIGMTAGLLGLASPARAATIAGVDTDSVLAQLALGASVDADKIIVLTSVDVTTLTLEELAALWQVLAALKEAGPDVVPEIAATIEPALAATTDQIAFLETVAEDRPTPASPL